MKLTIVIPVRIGPLVYEARERLMRIVQTVPKDLYEILIVDYGTSDEHRSVLDELASLGVWVHQHKDANTTFSIGHARDIGVQVARTNVVLFHDIDFFCSAEMYQRIHEHACVRDIENTAYEFFCVPVLFLTELGSSEYLKSLDSPHSDLAFQSGLLLQPRPSIDFIAFGSSAIVVNKFHYLGIGGHGHQFVGHGAEDYELLHRLGTYRQKGPRTFRYYTDTKSNQVTKYAGFRAYFALFGLDVFYAGIWMTHLWHPTRRIAGYYQSSKNFNLLADLMKRFDRNGEQPHPRENLAATREVLFLCNPNASTFSAIRHALPLLGRYVAIDETTFQSGDELEKYVRAEKFSGVLFLNPYGNPHRLALYEHVRGIGLKYWVFDRGALPRSWFFDPNGFNADSVTYAPAAWNVALDEAQRDLSQAYQKSLVEGEDTLESAAGRRSARYLREKLGAGRRKVLFVPLQRPSDTVTNYFVGNVGRYDQFIRWVAQVSESLKKTEWLIVCKKHPLEDECPAIPGVVFADADTHVNDLLELADKVLLMNSGVGVLALAFGKPVIACSHAFYGHPGLCFNATSAEDALKLVHADLSIDREAVDRFFYHLIRRVYSFADARYRKTMADDGSSRSIVSRLVFENVRFSPDENYELGRIPRGASLDAPLFYSFGGRQGVRQALESSDELMEQIKQRSPRYEKVVSQRKSGSISRKLWKLLRDPKRYMHDFWEKRRNRTLIADSVLLEDADDTDT